MPAVTSLVILDSACAGVSVVVVVFLLLPVPVVVVIVPRQL